MNGVLYTTRKSSGEYKLLIPLACIFVMIQAISTIVIYKQVGNDHYYVAASAIVYTLDYSICNILAEVYGYNHTRQIIWVNAGCILLFTLGIQFIIDLPSPHSWQLGDAYNSLYGAVWRQGVGGVIAVTIGYFLNSYLIQKLKILWYGKHFIIRQLSSCAISELALLTVGYSTIFLFSLPFTEILTLIFYGWVWKISANIIQAPFVNLIAKAFKRFEKTDIYDYDISFSPFKF
ncbi:queuosine precursor transporter [Thiotrichales bacterium 19S11-10]|nr:queuosine precursor transporter [Thiotrichales bacterium 19S11-10]